VSSRSGLVLYKPENKLVAEFELQQQLVEPLPVVEQQQQQQQQRRLAVVAAVVVEPRLLQLFERFVVDTHDDNQN